MATLLLRNRLIRLLVLLAALGFLLLNLSAFMHAYRMTHFAPAGKRTRSPEELNRLEKAWVLLVGVTLPRPVSSSDPGSMGMAFERVSIEPSDGPRLAAWFIASPGRGRGTVLMFHGYGACKASQLAEARVLHEAGWDVLLVDSRGSGDSDGGEITLGYLEALDVAAARRWLREHQAAGRPVVLYGSSMGAAAVMRAIHSLAVQADGVVLECPFDRFLTTVRHRFRAMGVPPFPGAELLVFWGGLQHGFLGFRHDPISYGDAISAPVLLLHGGKDRRVRPEEVRRIAERMPGRVELHVFERIGHESYCAADPVRYRDIVVSWLARSFPTTRPPPTVTVAPRSPKSRAEQEPHMAPIPGLAAVPSGP